MKLIRLYSNNTTGLINNDLYSDAIQLKPYSQISLYNASISLSYNNIVVDNDNRTFQFSTTSAPQFKKTVNLDIGDYTAEEFILHVERKMNALIDNNALGNGVQFVVSKTTDNLLKIQFSKPNNQSTSGNLVPQTNLINLTNVGGGIYNKTGGSDYQGYGYSDLHFTRGSGHVITTLTNNLNSYIFGLIDNKPDSTQTLDHTYYSYAIKYDHVLDKYFTIVDGVETDTGLSYNVSEPLRITKNSGGITFYKNNISIGTSGFNDTKHYYLGFSIKNTDANTIGTLSMTPDNNESVFLVGEDYYNLGAQPSTVGLFFNIYSKALLGFTDDKIITGTEGVFQATHSFLTSNSPTSIIVECVNLNLNSYDFSQNKRKSILATIPILQEQADRLIYNNINPIFITINNEYPMALNNLTLRFIDARDNSEISVGANGIDATILIKDA